MGVRIARVGRPGVSADTSAAPVNHAQFIVEKIVYGYCFVSQCTFIISLSMRSLTVSASGCSLVSEEVSLLCLRGVGSAGVRGTTSLPLGRLGPVCTILESLRSRNCQVCRVLGVYRKVQR